MHTGLARKRRPGSPHRIRATQNQNSTAPRKAGAAAYNDTIGDGP
jgi:hypothetical protein